MRGLKPTRSALAVVATAVLLTAALGTALAAVTVYDNNFSSRAKYSEIAKSGGGKRCARRFRAKSKAMRAAVKQSPTTCSFRPPVQGDHELPNHDVRLDGKILKKTPKSVRGGAFLELDIRAGGGGVGYSLRVFPRKRRFELLRGPTGNGFPEQGTSDAIKKVNERNQLRLIAAGAEIRALINGKEVAKVNDDNPGQVSGRKIRFAVGSRKHKDKDVIATFKKIAVAVPEP